MLELRDSDILDLYDTIINYGYNMQDIIHGPQGTSAYICSYLFIIYNDLIYNMHTLDADNI